MRSPLLALTAALTALTLTGCGAAEEGFRDGSGQSSPTPAPAAAPASPTAAPVTQLEIPDLDGRNGAIALDELQRAGFTNAQPASADDEDKVVINPANWTVTKVEPGAGETVASDSVVVVTMSKK